MHTALPAHCTPTSPYLVTLSSAFHSCVPTSLALVSTALGIFSIIAWLFAQVPQIYKNYTLKSASGLSVFFLTEWLFGDLTNLLGSLLTGQAQWQVGLATYYVTVDVCLMSQYLWYTHFQFWTRRRLLVYKADGNEGDDSPSEVPVAMDSDEMGTGVARPEQNPRAGEPKAPEPSGNDHGQTQLLNASKALILTEKPTQSIPIPPRPSNAAIRMSQKALFVTLFCVTAAATPLHEPYAHQYNEDNALQASSRLEFVGRIFSWMSALLYLGSRFPQIYKNAMRRSTSGLSPYMFLAAFCGNFLYSAAVVANPLAWASYPPYGAHGWVGPEGSDRLSWIALAAPFWLGAAGVLVLDATVGVQFLVYGGGEEDVIVTDDRKGKRRWKRVTGGMRGWIPGSNGSAQAGNVNEEERPLIARTASRGSRYNAT